MSHHGFGGKISLLGVMRAYAHERQLVKSACEIYAVSRSAHKRRYEDDGRQDK
jgi:hypothetical protein